MRTILILVSVAVVPIAPAAWAVNLALPGNSPNVEVIGHPIEGGGAPNQEHLRLNDNLIPPNDEGASLLVRTDLGSAVHLGIGYDFGGLAVGVTDITIWEKNNSVPEAVTVYYDNGSKSFTNVPGPPHVGAAEPLVLSLDNIDTRYVYIDFEAPDPTPFWDISEVEVEGNSLNDSVMRVQPLGHTLNGNWTTATGFDPIASPYGARVEDRLGRTANGFSSLREGDSIQFDLGASTLTTSIGINQANTTSGGVVYDMLDDVVLEFSDDPTFNNGVTVRNLAMDDLLGYQLLNYLEVTARHVRLSAGSVFEGGAGAGEVGLSGILFYNSSGTFMPIATRFVWNTSGLGDWGTKSNWSAQGVVQGPLANNPNHTAIFPENPAITGPTNVSTMEAVTVNRIEFANSTFSYVVSGLGSVNMASTTSSELVTPTMSVTGMHEFQVDVNLHSPTTVDVTSDSQLIFDGALDLGGNVLTKTGAGDIAIRNDLITSGGTLNCSQGACSGSGTISGDLNNDGGVVSPGNRPGMMAVEGGNLSVIPEPGTAILLGLGLMSWFTACWRRRLRGRLGSSSGSDAIGSSANRAETDTTSAAS